MVLMPLSLLFASWLLSVALSAGAGGVGGMPSSPTTPPPAGLKAPPADRYGDPLPPGALGRLGTVRWRVRHRLFEDDGSLDRSILAVGTWDGDIHVIETRTGHVLYRLHSANDTAYSLAKVSLKRHLLVAFEIERHDFQQQRPGHACVWDVVSGKLLRRFEVEPTTECLALSADGRVMATVSTDHKSGASIQIWDVDSAKRRRTIPRRGDNKEATAILSPDGSMLAFWSSPDQATVDRSRGCPLHLFDPSTGGVLARLQTAGSSIRRVAFSPNGKTLAVIGESLPVPGGGSTLQVFDLASRKETLRSDAPAAAADTTGLAGNGAADASQPPSRPIAYSDDGKLLAVGTAHGGIKLYEAATGRLVRQFPAPPWQSFQLAFAEGRVVAYATPQHSIHIWDPSTRSELTPSAAHNGSVCSIAFTADDRRIVSSGFDGDVCVWDPATSLLLHRANLVKPRDYVIGPESMDIPLPLAPDGRHAVLIGERLPHRLIDVPTGHVVHEMPHQVLPAWIFGARFSADARTAVLCPVGDDNHLCVWDVQSGKVLGTFGSFALATDSMPFALDVSSAQGRIAVLTRRADPNKPDKLTVELGVWELATRRRLWHVSPALSATHQLAISPDGEAVAFVEKDGEVTLRAAATGKELRKLATGVGWHATNLQYEADGRTLAIGEISEDGGRARVLLLEVASGGIRAEFHGHCGPITCLAWSHDRTKLASGSTDTTVLLWNLPGRQEHATDRLSAEQGEQVWAELASGDAASAYKAEWRLRLAGQDGLTMLEMKLKPVDTTVPEPAQLEKMVRNLDTVRFAEREAAMGALRRAGKAAEPVLRKAVAGELSPEKRQRLERLLAGLGDHELSPEELREVRAIEALEAMNTPESRKLLVRIAAGRDDALVTKEAKASLRRLACGIR